MVDLEWSPKSGRLLAVGWADADGDYCQVPGNVPRRVWERLAAGVPIVEFTKSDAVQLLRRGYRVNGPIVDLQVAAWVLNENQRLDLDSIARKYPKIGMDKRLVRRGDDVLFRCDDGTLVPIDEAPLKQLRDYCRRDVVAEVRVLWSLLDKLERNGWLEYFIEEEVPFTRVLVEMELAGIPIDLRASERLRSELEAEHEKLARKLTAGLPSAFNIGSDTQVGDYLFRKKVRVAGRIPVDDRIPNGFVPDPDRDPGRLWVYGEWVFPGLGLKRGELTDSCKQGKCDHEKSSQHRGATNKTALRMNPATRDNEWARTYLEYQKVDTLLTVFLRKFPVIARDDDDGHPRIYCQFNQTGTRTGRLSSSNPNMQNVPTRGEMGKRIRELFRTPDRGRPFLIADYSQLETRLMAHFSGDPELVRIFREGRDPFIELASRIYGRPIGKEDDERASTKNVWYAQGYGAMPPKMFEMVTMEGVSTTLEEIEDLYTELQDLLPVYFDWRENLIADAKDRGYVETIGGRRRRIKFGGDMPFKVTAHGERAAANAKVQGSAADIVRRTMVGFYLPALQLILQVHDELMYQYRWRVAAQQRRVDAQLLKHYGEKSHGFDLDVPLVFDAKVCYSWAEKG